MIRKLLGRLLGKRVVALNVMSGGASIRWVHQDTKGKDYVIIFGMIYLLDDEIHTKDLIWLT